MKSDGHGHLWSYTFAVPTRIMALQISYLLSRSRFVLFEVHCTEPFDARVLTFRGQTLVHSHISRALSVLLVQWVGGTGSVGYFSCSEVYHWQSSTDTVTPGRLRPFSRSGLHNDPSSDVLNAQRVAPCPVPDPSCPVTQIVHINSYWLCGSLQL